MLKKFTKTWFISLAFAVLALGSIEAGAANSGIVQKVFVPTGAGAVTRSIDSKLADVRKSVFDYGAKCDGTTNDTAAFTKARTVTGGRYHIPSGTCVVDASPNVFGDTFTAGDNASVKVAGVTYSVANAFAGPWRYSVASPTKLNMLHAVSGNTVMYLQDGGAGTATGFYRGLAFTTDSHFLQAQPATNGGATDLLFQRSTLNADAAGNRFNFTFEENTDRLLFNYATSASGSPVFDSAMQIYAGVSPSLIFPALRPQFQQGWTVQTRAGGALKLSMAPGATKHTLVDDTTANEIASYTRSAMKIGGITFTSAYDAATYSEGPQRWGGTFGDLATALPVAKTLFVATGATNYAVIGTLRVAAVSSGSTRAWRESRFTYDGTTLTVTDLVNTLPAQIVATMAMSGTSMQFQASYAGGLGGGVAVTASVEWSQAGR